MYLKGRSSRGYSKVDNPNTITLTELTVTFLSLCVGIKKKNKRCIKRET